MLRENKTITSWRISGVLLVCVFLFGSVLLLPTDAQAGRGHRDRGRYTKSARSGRVERGRHDRRHYAKRRSHEYRNKRHYRRDRGRYYKRHRRSNDWVNFGWTIGNIAWSAANLANSRTYYYNDPVIIERPVYVRPYNSYDDYQDVRTSRNWYYDVPGSTTRRTEVVICP